MEWPKIEQKVNEAEKAKRRSNKSSQVLYAETGIRRKERDEMNRNSILEGSKKKRRVERTLSREEIFEQEAKELMGEEDSPENRLKVFRFGELKKVLRWENSLGKQREKLLEEKAEILSEIKKDPSDEESEDLREINEELEKNSELKDKMIKSSPEAYFGLHLKQLKEYKEGLEKESFIELPSVEKIEEEAIETIRSGRYPAIWGHMGSGKTEFAKHLAWKLTGKEALLFGGSKETSKAELMGHLALHKGEMPSPEEMIEIVEKEIQNFDEKNPNMTSQEKERRHSIIEKYVIEREKTGTETTFDLGYVYKAMQEGKPLIIDEWNMIPHSVMARLNELLKEKPGDPVNVQEDGVKPFRVKEGFFIIMTGNLNQRDKQYAERADLDPAHLRRIHPIKYDYLPQYTQKEADDSLLLSENAGAQNELFQLMLAKLMDRNGNLEVPKGSVEKLWNLAMGARISQDLFAGRDVSKEYYPRGGGQTINQPNFLKKFNFDLGRITTILGNWKRSQDRDLDFYVWRYGVGEAIDPMDKATIFQILKLAFGFFKGWQSNEEDVLFRGARELEVVPIEKRSDKKVETEFFGPRELIEFAFGKAPERATWPYYKPPSGRKPEDKIPDVEKMMELRAKAKEYSEWLERIKKMSI